LDLLPLPNLFAGDFGLGLICFMCIISKDF